MGSSQPGAPSEETQVLWARSVQECPAKPPAGQGWVHKDVRAPLICRAQRGSGSIPQLHYCVWMPVLP